MSRLLTIAVLAACGDDSAPPATIDMSLAPDASPTGWASAPALPIGATQETAVVASSGKIYVLGGFDGALAVVDAVQIFDPATATWSMGPALPKPVHHANATVLADGTIVVAGAMQTLQFTAIGDTWTWNPASETAWTVRAPMPAAVARGAGVTGVIDGKVVVAGGLRSTGAVAEVSIYDPTTDAWTVGPPLPAGRDHGCGGVAAGKLIVAGGRMANIGSTSPRVFAFDGAQWTERAMLPTSRGGTACGVAGDRLIVAGGEGNPNLASGVYAEVEAYDAMLDTWATLAPMQTPRHGTGGAVVGDRFYVPGGATTEGFGAVATHEVLAL